MKQGWEIKKLGEIGELKYGYTEKASLQKNGPKFLRITDIQDDLVNWCLVPYCKCNDSEYEKYKLEINDIVFARTGATTGKSFLIETLEEASVFASYLIRLRIDDKGIYPRYLMHFLKTEYYWSIINQGISGSAQGGFNASKLAELHICYPQFTEQERIVGILDSAFAKIEALRANAQQNLQNTKNLFQASLKQELTPKQGWTSESVKDLSKDIFAGGDAPQDSFSEYRTDKHNIPIYANAVKDDGLYGFTDSARVIEPSLTIAARGSGTGYVLERKEAYLPIVRLIVIIPKQEQIQLRYLYYSFKGLDITRSGSAIPQLTVPMIKNYTISFPLIAEQTSIVEKLDSLSERCRAMEENYRQTIAHCNALKQALLTKAFNGEL